jgi:uncharacterized membrane protein
VPVLEPHLPATQARSQQSLKLWHVAPFCAQLCEPVPHVPWVQAWLQHCAALEQVDPTGSQVGVGAPHTPLVQLELQQSLAVWHTEPLALQDAADSQLPEPQLWLQQALLALQLAP